MDFLGPADGSSDSQEALLVTQAGGALLCFNYCRLNCEHYDFVLLGLQILSRFLPQYLGTSTSPVARDKP